jgi:putative N6-adenine-specific DNA methylase
VSLSERALTRRLKRYVRGAEHRFLATCAPGFEDVLEGEVRELEGAKDLTVIEGGVEFGGPFELIYHANLKLRTANRVLWRLAEFLAQSYPMLYDRARKLPWERYLGFAPEFAVKVSAKTSRLRHHKKLAATLHAAVTRALGPHGLEPALRDGAPLTIHLRMFRDRCTLSLDTSGELLSRRGYRQAAAKAPIRESLAAACLIACNWQDYDLIVDPMCGSGTFIVEAALLAHNIAPGGKRAFAFEHVPAFQAARWERIKAEARAQSRASPLRLVAADLNSGALHALQGNAERACVLEDIIAFQGDARALDYRNLQGASRRPLLVGNPPYGLRIGERKEVIELYRNVGERLKEHAKGWDFALISPDPVFLEASGLEARPIRFFRSGGLRVGLYRGRIG